MKTTTKIHAHFPVLFALQTLPLRQSLYAQKLWTQHLLLLLCILGRLTPHRSFTHSLPGMLLMSYAVYLIYPPFAQSFCLSFLSHLALDILNKKPVRLLYPLRKGISLNLCYADGIVNRLLLWGGILAISCYILLFFSQLPLALR